MRIIPDAMALLKAASADLSIRTEQRLIQDFPE
jgi:hypothetical protein